MAQPMITTTTEKALRYTFTHPLYDYHYARRALVSRKEVPSTGLQARKRVAYCSLPPRASGHAVSTFTMSSIAV